MIKGLFETHINVSDLEKSADFYENTLGLTLAYEDSRRCRFYWLGDESRKAMLGLWEKNPTQIISQHFAFETSNENMKSIVPWLKERGLKVRNFLDDGTEDPFVFGWVPAVSIYFRDPDGHSLEFISILPDEPQPELGVVAWEVWEKNHGRSLKLHK
ncbi:VOC family protein [Lysinibacillus xylanilyticus]|uniref:VOC family protein n=1 Tax=Lysinibacillus xylanilyticus TaxID=582475 RepID=UPI003813E3A4